MSDFAMGLGIGLVSAVFCLVVTLLYLSINIKLFVLDAKNGLPEVETCPPTPKDINKPPYFTLLE